MKRDLNEFSQAVQKDASKLVAATATTMKEKLHINVCAFDVKTLKIVLAPMDGG